MNLQIGLPQIPSFLRDFESKSEQTILPNFLRFVEFPPDVVAFVTVIYELHQHPTYHTNDAPTRLKCFLFGSSNISSLTRHKQFKCHGLIRPAAPLEVSNDLETRAAIIHRSANAVNVQAEP